jgi:Nucleotidyl transferase AbiEii toxin, Type IV TA system
VKARSSSAEVATGPLIKVASLIDLAGLKVAVLTQRAESRDYIDIHALLMTANIRLADMLAAATIIYGAQFNPLLSLKALAYFDDLALAELPAAVRRDLVAAVTATDPRHLPNLTAIRRRADGS